MRQTALRLGKDDRATVNKIRSQGLHHAREVNRAHMLACLDQGMSEAQILAVLGVGRTSLWRTRAAYLQGGIELALFDVQRAGRPAKYGTNVEAQVNALACSAPPAGCKHWTMVELEQAARRETGMAELSRETVRRMLKKTTSNRGAA